VGKVKVKVQQGKKR